MPNYPRIERNKNGELIINIGPYAGMAPWVSYVYAVLPQRWPDDWPEEGAITMDDPRVTRYLKEI